MLYGKHWESQMIEMAMASIRPNGSRSARLSLLAILGDGTSRIGRGPLSMKISEKTMDRIGILLGILGLLYLLMIFLLGAIAATEF